MIMWVDADACPKDAKDLIYRAADRYQLETVLVANAEMRVPKSAFIRLERVGKGFDIADDFIAENAGSGDLVITADIPLAGRVVAVGAVALDPRGGILDEDTVHARLATRNLLAELREVGMMGGGPPPYKPKDRAKFASALDRLLHKLTR